jgi:hypothetical protein
MMKSVLVYSSLLCVSVTPATFSARTQRPGIAIGFHNRNWPRSIVRDSFGAKATVLDDLGKRRREKAKYDDEVNAGVAAVWCCNGARLRA